LAHAVDVAVEVRIEQGRAFDRGSVLEVRDVFQAAVWHGEHGQEALIRGLPAREGLDPHEVVAPVAVRVVGLHLGAQERRAAAADPRHPHHPVEDGLALLRGSGRKDGDDQENEGVLQRMPPGARREPVRTT
jgi:hypothetical protein